MNCTSNISLTKERKTFEITKLFNSQTVLKILTPQISTALKNTTFAAHKIIIVMKQLSILLSGLALLGVILLLVLRFAPDEVRKPDSTPEDIEQTVKEVAQEQSQVAFINTDTVMVYYELAQKLEDQLSQQQVRYKNRMNSEEKKLMQKLEEFRSKASTMGRFEGQMKQEELQKKERELYELQEDLARKLNKTEREYTAQINDSLEAFLNDYMRGKSYKIAVTQTYGGAVLWGHDDADLTRTVIDGLNRRFNAVENENEEK